MSDETKKTLGENGIYDAKSLGTPKVLLLGLQHMFAMFGATILVPMLTGLDVSTTLLFAGLGTLLFHFICKGKVPAFLGSSFAFLGGYAAIAPMIASTHNKVRPSFFSSFLLSNSHKFVIFSGSFTLFVIWLS